MLNLWATNRCEVEVEVSGVLLQWSSLTAEYTGSCSKTGRSLYSYTPPQALVERSSGNRLFICWRTSATRFRRSSLCCVNAFERAIFALPQYCIVNTPISKKRSLHEVIDNSKFSR